MGEHSLAVWLGFSGAVAVLLFLDLAVLNRHSHVLTMREALRWSGSIVALALLFGVFLLLKEGTRAALEYYTGYLIELSLSVDNLFVFILVFQYFGVPAELQPRVLKWGILGAIVMRLIMIMAGALLLDRFHWIIYIFGGILIYTGIHMFSSKEERIEPERNPVVRLARRILPFTDTYDGQRFFTRSMRGTLMATPLLLVLLVIEWTDLVFAIDSIPAVFAVTRDPFIVYTSNIFAILGLRALFFVLADMMHRFDYLKPAIAVILIFVGIKMTVSNWVHLPTLISLGFILVVLSTGVILSLRKSRREAMGAAG
ncbi:MAG TPA: TerC family protein [Gemmatimonadales bacterium]